VQKIGTQNKKGTEILTPGEIHLTGWWKFGIFTEEFACHFYAHLRALAYSTPGPPPPPGAPGTPLINLVQVHLLLLALLHTHETATLACVPPLHGECPCDACD
jgi:hypothetical protein